MTGKTHRNFIFIASIGPPLGVAAGVVLLWNDLVGWVELALFAAFYLITAIGISVGYHRLLAHRSFKTTKPVRLTLAVFGTLAAQGPAITWASHHRKHHNLADREGDPHSPHLHGQEGLRGLLRGFWHAHLGWLFDEKLSSEPMRYVPDLVREKELRWVSTHFVGIVLAGIALPGAIAYAITGRPLALLTGMLWGGLARIFMLSHATYAVNSLGHIVGRRRFRTADESRNVFWLALPSLGEAYHNNHHAFPSSAVIGQRRSELDLGALVVLGLERIGKAWDVVRPKPALVERRSLDEEAGSTERSAVAPPAGDELSDADAEHELVGGGVKGAKG